jgi:hypothetical protein
MPSAALLVAAALAAAPAKTDLFDRGESLPVEAVLPANERGVTALAFDKAGRLFGGTTGRAGHLFTYDPTTKTARSLARFPGGVGLAFGLAVLPDGSVVVGTQADPTGTASTTDRDALGHLYRVPANGGPPEDLGVPVKGQGVYALAYAEATNEVLLNTWPEGHFVAFDLAAKKATDHGAIAGHRTFETPFYAEHINRHTNQGVSYPRQVSRGIAVVPGLAALTAGADGELFRYDFATRKLTKTGLHLPAARGREPWCSLDAVTVYPRTHEGEEYPAVVGGTSDGHLFELRLYAKQPPQLRPRGKPFAAGGVQGLARVPAGGEGGKGRAVVGLCGRAGDVPRAFRFSHGGSTSAVTPGGLPVVDGQVSLETFGALAADGGGVYAGELDRIARLVYFPFEPPAKAAAAPPAKPAGEPAFEPAKTLPCHVVFAPGGTTTEASGYTALAVGTDGRVYVGSARYGDYAWLLRFDPAARPTFMDKVVNIRQLTAERKTGIHTQGKIHARILPARDGKIYFATKQAHEVFETRPEYGEDGDGYPGGHLCVYDPATNVGRSLGILMPREGLMGGVLDEARGRLVFRSEPRNHLLVYDLPAGDVRDRGNVGAMGRYMAADRKGRVYTVGRGDTLARYDPATDTLDTLTVRVAASGGYRPPYVLTAGPDGKLYGAVAGHPYVMCFDVDAATEGPFPAVPVRNVTPAGPAGWPVQDVHAGTFGLDGRFYFPLNTTGPLTAGGKPEAHLRVMAFDPKTGRTETVGIPDTSSVDESKVRHAYIRTDVYKFDHMQGAAVGADGTLFLMDIYPQLNVACFPRLTAPK